MPVNPNRQLYKSLKDHGAKNVKYTEYPAYTTIAG
ncbi:hypothetical protein [[Flexibacter] sp. ATCC 35208]